MKEKGKNKIGVALGGGGGRGLAHVGVLKCLEDHNISPSYIAGTSIGALVGGIYASGTSVKKIEKVIVDTDWRRVLSMLDPRFKKGLVEGKKVRKFIEKHIVADKIEDCRIPFLATATDLETGDVVEISNGKLVNAIMASISIPLFFRPVKRAGRILVDGGLSAPVPTKEVKNMGADIVLGVNLKNYSDEEKKDPGWYDIANNSISILYRNLALSNMKEADIKIDVDVKEKRWYSFTKGKSKIEEGEKVMRKKVKELKKVANIL